MPRRLLLSLFALAVLCASCARDKNPVAPPPSVLDGAFAPEEAVRAIEWAWENRNWEALDRILTEDFRFEFGVGDSSGNGFRDRPFTFEDELRTSRGCFESASEVRVEFDKTLIALGDERPGHAANWFRSVRTKVNLRVTLAREGGLDLREVSGFAKFYAVRGDSAALSPAQIAAGGRDSTRWWISRWEDETLPWNGASAHPSSNTTWGRIKVMFF